MEKQDLIDSFLGENGVVSPRHDLYGGIMKRIRRGCKRVSTNVVCVVVIGLIVLAGINIKAIT